MMLFKTGLVIIAILVPFAIYFSSEELNQKKNRHLTRNRRIYFHETSGKSSLNFRSTCAVESAAKENQDRPVQLFMQINGLDDDQKKNPWYSVLTQYNNIEIILINSTDYFANTPLEKWHNDGVWRNGKNQFPHFSDYIRMLSLYKGGGLYMDLDFITLKPLNENIIWNFLPIEDKETASLTGSIFHFEAGHRLVDIIIKRLAAKYNPNSLTAHGPALITKVMKDLCGFKPGDPFSNQCKDVQLLPYHYFYPISYENWRTYFTEINSGTVTLLNQSYGVHVWNKMSNGENIVLGPNDLYTILAKKHCPNAFDNLSKFKNV